MNKETCLNEMNEADKMAQQYLHQHRDLRNQLDYARMEERLKLARGLREMHALYKEQLLRYQQAKSLYTSCAA